MCNGPKGAKVGTWNQLVDTTHAEAVNVLKKATDPVHLVCRLVGGSCFFSFEQSFLLGKQYTGTVSEDFVLHLGDS